MHRLRCLLFIEAHYWFQLSSSYITTQDNKIADYLSRNKLTASFSSLPQADNEPTPIPPNLVPLLLDPLMDWLSPAWTQQFRSIFNWD